MADVAIDLIDEAASQLQIETETVPSTVGALGSELDRAAMGVRAMERELRMLSSTGSTADSLAVRGVDRELVALREKARVLEDEREGLLDAWTTGRASTARSVSTVLDDSAEEKDAEGTPQFIPVLSAQHIANIVAKSTGIPVGSLLDAEKADLLNMESALRTQVVGQDHALTAIAKCIRLSRAGLRHHDRPLGVLSLVIS